MSNSIKLIGEGLDVGETWRGECPFCGRAKVFTVSRVEDGSLLYNCYRANCNKSGRVGGVRRLGNLLCNKRQAKQQTVRPFTGDLAPLSDEWREFLTDKVGFDDEHFEVAGALYEPEGHRIAYPIYSPMGPRRGLSLRTYTPGVEPKALTRMEVAEPHLSWYRPRPESSEVLVVEDIPSAVRAARYVPQTVSLLGTRAGIDYVAEIAQFSRSITWALDQDATAQALRLRRKYASFFEDAHVLPLPCDLKDMKENDLCNFLTERT